VLGRGGGPQSPPRPNTLKSQFHLEIPASFLLALLVAALYAWAAMQRHDHYQSATFDLGLLTQVIWNTLHGRWFGTSIMDFNYLAEHFSPALILLSPLFLLWSDTRVLLIAQAAAISVAGVGIYLTARQRTRDPLSALLLQTAYCLAPAAGWVALDDFHPVSLALPTITFATALFWRRRLGLAALAGALALLANEDVVPWVAAFGIMIILAGRRRAAMTGVLLAAGAVVWLAAYLFLIVPAVRPPELIQSDPHPDIGVFVYCGRTWSAIASCLVHDPSIVARQALRPGGAAAFLAGIAPTAGLGLLGPSFLVALPRWLVLLLSVDPSNFRNHYIALLVPTSYLAAAEAMGWLHRRFRVSPRIVGTLVALASLIAYRSEGTLPGGLGYHPAPPSAMARVAQVDKAVGLIPTDPNVSVVATSAILPHLALRTHVYLLAGQFTAPPDYRIYDLRDAYPMTQQQLRDSVTLVKADPGYRVIFDQDDLLVLEHAATAPAIPLPASFGGQILLHGYTATAEGNQLRLELFWESAATMNQDYHYFVHIVANDGKGYTQQDGQLLGGLLPTTKWKAGAEIRDEVILPAPPAASWGSYHLEIGWYDWTNGQRLKLPDGSDHVVVNLSPGPSPTKGGELHPG